ncbi:unnamed protein product [Soboliphyme baturini]|uniref:Suf domain-containing protein n=1 Tax=Soboliphyme baturini TaxID=241478 RepID=A0A183I8Z1_9BILA|nr:unnamed protein product [Soboliphyme baturini]
MENGNYQAVLKLYDDLLDVPTYCYNSNFDSFKEFVNSQEPHNILSSSEYEAILPQVIEELKAEDANLFKADELTKEDAVEENGTVDSKNVPTKVNRKYTPEGLKLFRAKIIEKRKYRFLKAEDEVSKRWNFEEQIKRPYFHAKPLERSELKNWRHYCDFEIEEADPVRIKFLFERCMIACALYEDMWLRYARYMERVDNEGARSVYRRACLVHLIKNPNPHLAWSAFEEKCGNYEKARTILVDFDRSFPGSLLIKARQLGLERRMAVHSAMREDGDGIPDFEDFCKHCELLFNDPKVPSKIASFYAIKYARFHSKSNVHIYFELVTLAYNRRPFNVAEVVAELDRALDSPDLADADKLRFSQKKLEFLEDFADDIEE